VTAALPATINVEAYVDYIGRSRGEFGVAKSAYVKTRSGWFSDRTANYLAMGTPKKAGDRPGYRLPATLCRAEKDCSRSRRRTMSQSPWRRSTASMNGICPAARRIAEECFDLRVEARSTVGRSRPLGWLPKQKPYFAELDGLACARRQLRGQLLCAGCVQPDDAADWLLRPPPIFL